MLEQYLQMFANLRTDRCRGWYPEVTYHRALHKPFLLPSVMDLIAQGRITQNLIEPSYRPGVRSCFLASEDVKASVANSHSPVTL
jgi:hypothetical protein